MKDKLDIIINLLSEINENLKKPVPAQPVSPDPVEKLLGKV